MDSFEESVEVFSDSSTDSVDSLAESVVSSDEFSAENLFIDDEVVVVVEDDLLAINLSRFPSTEKNPRGPRR